MHNDAIILVTIANKLYPYPYAISTQIQLFRSPSTSSALQLSELDTVPSSPRTSGESESGLAVGPE